MRLVLLDRAPVPVGSVERRIIERSVKRLIVRTQTDTVFDTVSDFSLTPQRRFRWVAAKNSRKNNGRGERI
jgi:hypothetical protein